MHLNLSPDQLDLREATAKLCRARFPSEVVRASEHHGIDRGRWGELADAGVFSFRLSEANGGASLHLAEAAVVFEELGRALVPGPLVATHLAAGCVPTAGAADVIGVVERADGRVLVEHLDDLDHLVVLDHRSVSVLTDVRSRRFTASGPARALDPLTPVWWIDELAPAEPIGGDEERQRWAQEGALLTAALAAGVATAATELACAYARQREQFDRPIASFQAVKHLLADMTVRAEMARTGVEAAAAAYDQLDASEAATAIASAMVVARDAACRNGRDGVLVHGGMGYTWEVDAHLFMKRAQILAQQFGTAAAFALQLGQTM